MWPLNFFKSYLLAYIWWISVKLTNLNSRGSGMNRIKPMIWICWTEAWCTLTCWNKLMDWRGFILQLINYSQLGFAFVTLPRFKRSIITFIVVRGNSCWFVLTLVIVVAAIVALIIIRIFLINIDVSLVVTLNLIALSVFRWVRKNPWLLSLWLCKQSWPLAIRRPAEARFSPTCSWQHDKWKYKDVLLGGDNSRRMNLL